MQPSRPPELSHAKLRDRLRYAENLARAAVWVQVSGVIAILLHRSSQRLQSITDVPLGIFELLVMLFFVSSLGVRLKWAVDRSAFLKTHRAAIAVSLLWIAVVPFSPMIVSSRVGAWGAVVLVSEAAILLRATIGLIGLIRAISSGGRNPAFTLVASFAVLVAVGTVLLMLPRSRADASAGGAPFHVALFTATSASCVTGLIVVDTSTYWSRTGQAIIMCLFQIGGLGIMTCGSFFALVSAQRMQIRESAFLADMLESESLAAIRKLILAILAFTIASELVGAALLSGLWTDQPVGERIFLSLFHSISAFCNAGFALMSDSFVSLGTRWQVWSAVPLLIIVGGLGFAVLADVVRVMRWRIQHISRLRVVKVPHPRARLSATSWLVLSTTVGLLLWGMLGFYVLEAAGPQGELTVGEQASASWFQSVTFRTAGFNTVDMAALQPGTKFFAIMLMFVGASPGSTGGGIKTVAFAVSMLAIVSLLKGRDEIELRGRTIPQPIVKRALMVVAMGIVCVLTTTLLIVVIESQPELFLDHLFEATSAFATVGVSSVDTSTLKLPSQIVIALTMFVGRVGPLTLLVGLARRDNTGRYSYPEERVLLG